MTVAYRDTQRLWNYWAIPQNATVIDWAFLRLFSSRFGLGLGHVTPKPFFLWKLLRDIYPQLKQLHQWGLPWLFGIDPGVCPIYLGLPWGIAMGPILPVIGEVLVDNQLTTSQKLHYISLGLE